MTQCADELRTLLSRIAPSVTFDYSETAGPYGVTIAFKMPPAHHSDYAFSFYLYPGGETGIAADRPNSPPSEFYWSKRFEAADYQDDDELQRVFLATIEAVLTRETFVLQKNGVFWTTFLLAYKTGSAGTTVHWVAAPKLGFKAPRIHGRKRFYRAFPFGDDKSAEPATTSGGGRTVLFYRLKLRGQ